MFATNLRHLLLLIATLGLIAGCDRPTPETAPLRNTRTLFFEPSKIGEPFGVASNGTDILVSDGENGRIVKLSKSGEYSVVNDKFDTPSQIAVSESGEIFVADSGSHTIKKISSTGNVETVAGVEGRPGFQDGNAAEALFRAPVGIAVSGSRVYVADTYNDRIRIVENGQVRTLAGSTRGFADSETAAIARFDTPTGIALGFDGSVIVADSGNGRLRAVRGDGATQTLAGGGKEFGDGPPNAAGLYQPTAVTVDRSGVIYFTDGSAIRKIDPTGPIRVTTISSENRGFADGALAESKFNRPNGLAVDGAGDLVVADSENQTVRIISSKEPGRVVTAEEIERSRPAAEQFRALAPPRWPYDPPTKTREIAGTLGEIRGENDGSGDNIWYHNGLDIVGGYGETARFIRDEKVLRASAAENFGTLRELLRMPTLGYIHIRLGRDASGTVYDDPRFVWNRDEAGKLAGVRVPRGARFKSGEAIGTLNAMNHVHLIAGRSGAEMNALAALELPGASDKIAPVIEKIALTDENFREFETDPANGRIKIVGKTRIVARAYDRMDGNADRRRLGIYRIGYQILKADKTPLGDVNWTIRFDRLPDPDSVATVFANGSKSGATGETVFRYIATNEVFGETSRENFVESAKLEPGNYVVRVYAADFFGNTAVSDLAFEAAR
ncbi:MAG: hypothetical protein IPN69_14495 [Acidobacteria bacterium]|nr:hypothetical protein [Acidobacteriota bacterium]